MKKRFNNKSVIFLSLLLTSLMVKAEPYFWMYLNGGDRFETPEALCAAVGTTPSYPMEGPRGWYGCWGVCGKCYVRWGDGCPVGTKYNNDLGACENTTPPPDDPGINHDPKNDCPSGNCEPECKANEDTTEQCNPKPDDCVSVGNPILIATGQKIEKATDLSIVNSALSFKRNYWSTRVAISNIGLAWQHNWRMYILPLNYKNQIKLYRQDGKGIIFTPNANGQWEAPVGVQIAVISTADSGWKVLESGKVEIYNKQGQLISYAAKGFKTISLAYNTIGQLISLTDTAKNKLTLSYNNKGLITTVTTDKGDKVTYSYDDKYRLIKVTKNGQSKQYHYENTQYPSALTGATDERGIRYVTWKYNDKGLAISSENANGANKYQLEFLDNDRTRVINPLGRATTYYFKNFLTSRKVVKVEGEPTGNCIATNSTYSRDYKGQIISETNENNATLNYEYNDRGLATKKTFSGTGVNYTTETKWHDTLPLPIEINKSGQQQTFKYDVNGRLVEYTNGFKDFSELNQGKDIALLQFNDFTDEAGNIWSKVGNPQIIDDSEAVTGKALNLDGNSYLELQNKTSFDFGQDDFTIEMWLKPESNGVTNASVIFDGMYRKGNGASFTTYTATTGVYWLGYQSYANSQVNILAVGMNIFDGNWHHVAYSRQDGVMRIFIDGKLEGSGDDKNNYLLDDKVVVAIGARLAEESKERYKGYIDQVRISKRAIYTKDFTPSREPYVLNQGVTN